MTQKNKSGQKQPRRQDGGKGDPPRPPMGEPPMDSILDMLSSCTTEIKDFNVKLLNLARNTRGTKPFEIGEVKLCALLTGSHLMVLSEKPSEYVPGLSQEPFDKECILRTKDGQLRYLYLIEPVHQEDIFKLCS